MNKKINAKEPTNFDQYESMDYIWEVLSDYRENCISEGVDNHDDIWDEICTSMSWIEDALGMRHGKAIDMFDERDEAMERFTNKLKNKLKKLK